MQLDLSEKQILNLKLHLGILGRAAQTEGEILAWHWSLLLPAPLLHADGLFTNS